MAIVTAKNESCKEICRSLGLDPKNVNKIIVEFDAKSLVTVYVKLYAEQDNIDKVTETIKVLTVQDAFVSDKCEVVYTK